jgi:protein SCO1/2
MRVCIVPLLLTLLAAGWARPQPAPREYELQGQILAVDPARSELTIKHGDITGFMPGMTMAFKVKDPALLSGKAPGDLVTATLVVGEIESHLSVVTSTGKAPIDTPAIVSDAPKVLLPGETVPDALLVDQDGAPRPFSTLRGHRVALTFIYTRCPLPDFCPLMDRHFAAVQKIVKSTPSLADVRLVTMTLDPEFDTPAVLKPHAQKAGADPAIWSFVTAAPKDAASFASAFGLYVEHNPDSPIDIIHNLRTAVIDAEGKLVTVHSGNDWTPAQLVADLQAAPAPAD